MAKLNRLTAKIFGETASTTNTPKEIGQFGSAKAGTYNATGDVATIQSLTAWSNGWIDAVTPTDQFPPLPEMTGVHKVLSYQEAYLLQQGIPEWDSATTYYENGFCSYNGIIYKSLIDENTNNQPDETSNAWFEYGSGDYANQDINNLTSLGNARLQYAPFAINAGKVINGNNHTLQSESQIESYAAAGTYSIEILEAGNYEIELYGAGGGVSNGGYAAAGHFAYTYGSGGSGSGFKAVVTLAVGTYTAVVGKAGVNGGNESATAGGASSFGGIVSCGGGNAGYAYEATMIAGTGGTVSILDSTNIVSQSLNSNGNNGNTGTAVAPSQFPVVYGGASVYNNSLSGYGVGGGTNGSSTYNAQDGFFQIRKLTGNTSILNCSECTITTADGRTKVFSASATKDVTSISDGSYHIFKSYTDGVLSLASNLTIAKTAPSTPSSGDYWLDTSTIPANLKIYDTSWTTNNDLVYIGDCTVSSGAVSAISNVDFNATQQGEWVTLNSTQELAHVTSAGSNTLSFSNVLPKDAYDYEVMCTLYFIGSSTTTGNSCNLIISDIKNPIDYFSVSAYARLVSWAGSLFLIDKKATFNMTFGSGASASYYLWVTAYRRIGVL